jgi:hypothetical protein
MSDLFNVVRNGKWFGPYSPTQLRALAASGKLRPTDGVWKEGMVQAVLAAKVKNLYPPPTPQPRPSDTAVVVKTSTPLPPTPTVSPCDLVAVEDPPPTPPEEVPGTTAQDVAAVPPALPAPATQTWEQQAGANAVASSRPRMRRATAMKGAVLVSQDGYHVHYRKKCSHCSFEDTCRSTMLINIGGTRSHFFCPKCRKNREVEIQGCMQ